MKKVTFDKYPTEADFIRAEAGMKFDKAGHANPYTPKIGPAANKRSGKMQTPAQHASVLKAGRISAAKRHARAGVQ